MSHCKQPWWPCAIGLAFGACLALTLPSAHAAAAKLQPPEEPLALHAREVLHQIMVTERSWIRIHAAEALMAAGESAAIREYFLSELPTTEGTAFRIGTYRVLATTALSPDERAQWIAKAERVYLDASAPDQNQAIETLCKLGHRVTGEALAKVRQNAVGPPAAPMALALWAGVLAGEPRSLDGLTALLTSQDPALRTSAAYSLRWLHPSDPSVRAVLAQAVAAEADTTPRSYLLGAAIAVDADPTQVASWFAQLDHILRSAAAEMSARFEASWTLKLRYPRDNLAQLAPLLDLPATDNDVRVGAASVILTTLARR